MEPASRVVDTSSRPSESISRLKEGNTFSPGWSRSADNVSSDVEVREDRRKLKVPSVQGGDIAGKRSGTLRIEDTARIPCLSLLRVEVPPRGHRNGGFGWRKDVAGILVIKVGGVHFLGLVLQGVDNSCVLRSA